MPLHIIKMTMIVIFVPSPPHPLLFSRVPAALSPPSSPRLPGRRCVPPTLTQSPSVDPVGERKRDFSLSLSLLSFKDGETRGDREDSEIPSRPVYSLPSLGPAHRRARARVSAYSYVSLGVSLSLVPPLTRSFLPLYPSKGFAPVSIFVVPRLSARAEEGSSPRASVGRPRTAYTCVRRT